MTPRLSLFIEQLRLLAVLMALFVVGATAFIAVIVGAR